MEGFRLSLDVSMYIFPIGPKANVSVRSNFFGRGILARIRLRIRLWLLLSMLVFTLSLPIRNSQLGWKPGD